MKIFGQFVLYTGIILGTLGGVGWGLDFLFPPPLNLYETLSKEVRLEDESLVHVFQTSDDKWRLKTDLADVHPLYLDLLVAREDRFFWNHFGVNPLSLVRALLQWGIHRQIISGGSTLTMQVIRLLEPRPRTFWSKLIEMVRAVQLEWHYSKDEILAMYITLAPFGGNLEGVRAASWAYFGKQARHLTPSEVALLVLLPQSPKRWQKTHFSPTVKETRNQVLAFAWDYDLIDKDHYNIAISDPLPNTRLSLPRQIHHLARRLSSENESSLISHCTLDMDLQNRLQFTASQILSSLPDGANLAILVAHHPSSKIMAYIGSGDFFDGERKGQIDYITAFRSPGSTLKPFIYGLAFDLGLIQPDSFILNDRRRFGAYAPHNFDRSFSGMVTVREALKSSLNIPAVSLLNQMGTQRLLGLFQEANISPRFAVKDQLSGLPLTLGGLGMTLEQLVTLYASLAQKGLSTELGVKTNSPSKEKVQILSEDATAHLKSILTQASPLGLSEGHEKIALKTGTSYGHRDALALGYNETYVVGIWVGHPEGIPLGHATGRTLATPILHTVFKILPRQTTSLTNREDKDSFITHVNSSLYSHSLERTQISNQIHPRILFPVEGALFEKSFNAGSTTSPLFLKVTQGKRPYTWLINGNPHSVNDHKLQTPWFPKKPGFYEIVVIDQDGQSERVHIEIKEGSKGL